MQGLRFSMLGSWLRNRIEGGASAVYPIWFLTCGEALLESSLMHMVACTQTCLFVCRLKLM